MNNKKKDSSEISFSILLANFNCGNYIEESIKSVLFQTFQNWELIIVDDCSDDGSIEKIKLFLNDKRIKLIYNKKHLGVGFTKKIAADNATNMILGILDADDKLHKKALEIMANAYRDNQDCGVIYSSKWNCDSELKRCKKSNKIRYIFPKKTLFLHPNIGHFKTFRKDIYKKTTGYDPTLKAAVDKDIIYKLEEVTNFKFINIPLYYYRQHEKGISQGKNLYIAHIYYYIVKLKTYRRRLKTNFPNFTLKDLYIEYFKINLNRIFGLLGFFKYFFNRMPKKIIKLLEYSLNLIRYD